MRNAPVTLTIISDSVGFQLQTGPYAVLGKTQTLQFADLQTGRPADYRKFVHVHKYGQAVYAYLSLISLYSH